MLRKTLKSIGIIFGLVIVASGITISYWIWNSTYKTPSQITLNGLQEPVEITEDTNGTPTLKGRSLTDLYRAQGWLLARDRFFQMDIVRRRGAGELAEIFGKRALKYDYEPRIWGLKKVADSAAAQMKSPVRERWQAYADGINDFLKRGAKPFEMRVLGYEPTPWTIRDSLLVVLVMFTDLDYHQQYLADKAITLLSAKRPKALVDFLTPYYGFYDAPISKDDPGFEKLPVPGPEVVDLRKEASSFQHVGRWDPSPAAFGSNGWVVSGKKTKSGLPLLAGDPHLNLSMPAIWYRLALEDPENRVLGVSLPGVPGVVIGSNGHMSWTFTNASSDPLDLVWVDDKDITGIRKEVIKIRGGHEEILNVEETRWGPVTEKILDRKVAVHWVALNPGPIALTDPTNLNRSHNTQDFIKAAQSWTGPLQNIMFASNTGDIGWTVVGNFPKRKGIDGRKAEVFDEHHGWDGYLSPQEKPLVLNPAQGFIQTANQRILPLEKKNPRSALRIGNNFAASVRGYRIAEILREHDSLEPKDMLDLQMEIYSHHAMAYRDVLVKELEETSPDWIRSHYGQDTQWVETIHRLLEKFDGRAWVVSPAYVFLRSFRKELITRVLDPLWRTPIEVKNEHQIADFWPVFAWYSLEPPLFAVLRERPMHLLSSHYPSYKDAILDCALAAAKQVSPSPQELETLRWGRINYLHGEHPFSVTLPNFLGQFFRLPRADLSGDYWVPKVAAVHASGRTHSASMRMIVDVSNPKNSLFNLPGGQSGHFISKNYKNQVGDWIEGTPTPFEPGTPVATYHFMPAPVSANLSALVH